MEYGIQSVEYREERMEERGMQSVCFTNVIHISLAMYLRFHLIIYLLEFSMEIELYIRAQIGRCRVQNVKYGIQSMEYEEERMEYGMQSILESFYERYPFLGNVFMFHLIILAGILNGIELYCECRV